MAVRNPEARITAQSRVRSKRLEVRTTEEERALIDRAVRASGEGLTEFVISNLTAEARRVLAERSHFVLDAEALARWDEINARPARELPGLRRLMDRPSPFAE